MKKNITILFLLIVIRSNCVAQDPWKKSIDYELSIATQDTSRVLLLAELGNYYKWRMPDSGLFYAYKALALARQIKFAKGEVVAMRNIGVTQITLGNDAKALQIILQATKIAEKSNLIFERAILLTNLGIIYNRSENYKKALSSFRESMRLSDLVHDLSFYSYAQNNIGATYLLMNQLDSALYYSQLAYDNAVQIENQSWVTHAVLLNLGRIQIKKGNIDLALTYLYQSLPIAVEDDKIILSNFSIAQLYQQIGKPDSCIYYAKKSLEIAQEGGFYSNAIEASILLSGIYEERDPQKALEYNKTAIAFKDSLYNQGRAIALENLTAFDQQERQYEIDTANTAYRNQIKQYVLIAGLIVFLLIVFILYRNNRHKQKAKVKIEKAYEELKSTQAQLVQREKMASLGELTAGIAHEIQNPLNFVNNFSEVNTELIDELEQEADKGNLHEVKSIAKGIKENEQKIVHHGKRADAIVKGMLQHSRNSSAVKEPTDINKLADEYLRLAYHGLRAKDKSFNATMKTDFDNTIGKVNIIPQDIGRVILNLLTNAFYAVNEKKKQLNNEYEPTVSVSTKKINGKVEIKVSDNGNGIPQKVLDKIFQPFFTTKPTGQGTGLGLSLSYDIVKAHSGELKVETKEGEGSEFTIQIPMN